MRAPSILATVLALAVWAAPAQAKLVYVKKADTPAPVVYTADDDGEGPRRIGVGRAPTVSPDGKWVAYVTVPRGDGAAEQVVLVGAAGGAQRLVMRSRSIESVRFSPDSSKLAAVLGDRRVRVYDIGADAVADAAKGNIRGYSFSPDGKRVAVGIAARAALDAPSDIYVAPVGGDAEPERITTSGDALNPVWGAREVVFDRQRRRGGDAPAFNIWTVDPAGAASKPRRLTKLSIPKLVSGLVPVEQSADGKRLLALFTGQDTGVGFTVSLESGGTRALSRDFEAGLVGFDLAADGATILAHTGGPDPGAPHDVVTLPYRGGEPTVLVRRAAFPDWSR